MEDLSAALSVMNEDPQHDWTSGNDECATVPRCELNPKPNNTLAEAVTTSNTVKAKTNADAARKASASPKRIGVTNVKGTHVGRKPESRDIWCPQRKESFRPDIVQPRAMRKEDVNDMERETDFTRTNGEIRDNVDPFGSTLPVHDTFVYKAGVAEECILEGCMQHSAMELSKPNLDRANALVCRCKIHVAECALETCVDSGATYSILNAATYDRIRMIPGNKGRVPDVQPTKTRLSGASGANIPLRGISLITFNIGNAEYSYPMIVGELSGLDVLLGIDWLDFIQAEINFGTMRMTLGQRQTVQLRSFPCLGFAQERYVCTRKSITLVAGHTTKVECQLMRNHEETHDFRDVELFEPRVQLGEGLDMAPCLVTQDKQCYWIGITNYTSMDVEIPYRTILGRLDPICTVPVDGPSADPSTEGVLGKDKLPVTSEGVLGDEKLPDAPEGVPGNEKLPIASQSTANSDRDNGRSDDVRRFARAEKSVRCRTSVGPPGLDHSAAETCCREHFPEGAQDRVPWGDTDVERKQGTGTNDERSGLGLATQLTRHSTVQPTKPHMCTAAELLRSSSIEGKRKQMGLVAERGSVARKQEGCVEVQTHCALTEWNASSKLDQSGLKCPEFPGHTLALERTAEIYTLSPTVPSVAAHTASRQEGGDPGWWWERESGELYPKPYEVGGDPASHGGEVDGPGPSGMERGQSFETLDLTDAALPGNRGDEGSRAPLTQHENAVSWDKSAEYELRTCTMRPPGMRESGSASLTEGSGSPPRVISAQVVPEHLRVMIPNASETGLSKCELSRIQTLLIEFQDIFVGPDGAVGFTNRETQLTESKLETRFR